MAERKTLSDSELKSLIQAELANCDGLGDTKLTSDNISNLDYYLGKPFGNELAGRSSVVSTDVRDTIEWMLPFLLRIFTSGENVVEFEPQEPKDVAIAKQATEYVNYIWNRDNKGFLTFYTWFKDALLEKNGIVKIWWDKSKKTSRERYYGLDDRTFATLVNDDAVTVSEHTEYQADVELPDLRPNMPTQVIKQTFHDVVLTRSDERGRCCVEPVPPEEFIKSKDARSVEDARLVGHKRLRTVSDLIKDGYSPAVINALPDDESAANSDAQAVARDTVEDTSGASAAVQNKAMRQIWVTEAYIKIDVDGDGVAEMRQIVVAGAGNEILANEPWDTPRPFANLTPIIMPHRFNGLAVADLIRDIQLIRSTLLRQGLDNLYLSNNQREQVEEARIVDPDEALSHKPGQKIRIKGTGPAVHPIVVPQLFPAVVEGLNYFDQIRENRTGVSARTQGLGTNHLHDTARGEQMMMSAAMSKMELIARVFAETGVKDAFRLILHLIVQYQDQPRVVRLTGKEFVPVDPRSWNADMDMTVSVGQGTGDKEQQMQAAMIIGQAQSAAAQAGILKVTPDNAMATAELLVNAAGQKGVERFFTKPDPNQPPPPSPEMMKVQAQAQADQAKLQSDGQIKSAQLQQEGAIKSQQTQADAALEQQKMQSEFALKQWQIEQEMQLKREQLAAELELKKQQLQAELAIKRELGLTQAAVTSDVHPGGEPG